MAVFSREIQTLLLLVGTIVGAGMFGIPFVFHGAGFVTGFVVLAGLAVAATLVHLAYAEVVLATPELHRLPGYVRHYLGPGFGKLSTASYLFGLSGTLLAYLILGGAFAGELMRVFLPALPDWGGPLAFYLFGVAVIFRSIRFESLTNAVLTLGLVAAIFVLVLVLLPEVSPRALAGFQPERVGVPYGVVLFSLAGAAIIPDMRRVLGQGGTARLRRLIISGTLGAAFLYFVFAAVVVGTTAAATTPDAIGGLAGRFGPGYLLAGSAIGFLATITSFITLGLVFEGMFVSDFGFVPRSAWLATVVIPAGLWLLGFQDFIAIVAAVGAVGIGFDSIFILASYGAIAGGGRRRIIALPVALRIVLAVIFGSGIVYAFSNFFV